MQNQTVALSAIVAGCWRMHSWEWTAQKRLAWISACIECGVSSFDHADIYGGYSVETLFGEALALDPSLRALRTDYLDTLLLHRPDPLLDADEVAEVFQRLQREGKVLTFGVSNFTPAQFALLHSRVPLLTNQLECSPLQLGPLHDGTFDQAQQLRIAPMIWSPLAGGKIFNSEDATALRVHGALKRIAAAYEVSVATMAYAWLARLPSRPHLIVGSSRMQAIHEALAALAIDLDAPSWHEIWAAGAGRDVP